MPLTRAELIQYARDNTGDGTTPKDNRVIIRACEEVLKYKLPQVKMWNAYKSWIELNLIPPQETGTATLGGDRKTVTIAGGVDLTDDELAQPEDNYFQVSVAGSQGNSFVHKIDRNVAVTASTFNLEQQWQIPGAITFSADTFKIFHYSYPLPANTRKIDAVISKERGWRLFRQQEYRILLRWATRPRSDRPRWYNVISETDPTSKEESFRIITYPAAPDTHVLDLIQHRKIEELPALDAGIIDVPTYLEGLMKALVLRRLASADRRWENIRQMAESDVAEETAAAKKEDAKHRASFTIGRDDDDEIVSTFDPWGLTTIPQT